MAGVDGSASSLEALRWAVRQADLTGRTVDAMIAWQYPAAAGGFGWGIGDDTDYAEVAANTVAEAISQAIDPASDARVRPPFDYLTSMVVTIGLWLTLAPAVGAIARTGRKS